MTYSLYICLLKDFSETLFTDLNGTVFKVAGYRSREEFLENIYISSYSSRITMQNI